MIPTLSAMTIDHLGFPSQRAEILLRGGLSDGGDAQEVRPGLQGGRGAAGPATRKPVAQVARELGIQDGALGNWVNADRRGLRQGGDGVISDDERGELARLRKENAELAMRRGSARSFGRLITSSAFRSSRASTAG